MLEKVVQLRNTIFAIHHLALTLKRMVEVVNPRQKFGEKIQYPYRTDKIEQSKHDLCGRDESSMYKAFD